MKFNSKNIMGLVVLASSFGNCLAVYSSAIDRKANQIRTRFINQPSGVVAAKNNPTLSDDFKGFLADDKIMQKIKKINVEGSSETTLEVTDLEENIAENWLQKENDLQAQRASCLPKQIVLGLLAGGGLAAALIAANDRNKNIKMTGVVAGAFVGLVGIVGLGMMAGEKGRLEKHIAQVQTMKKDWNAFFVVPEN